jgi:sporulation protein YlmC with PRC-barrel domain
MARTDRPDVQTLGPTNTPGASRFLIRRRGYDDADPSIQEEGTMITESEFRSLVSREVIDRNGKSVGYVEAVFKDRESGRPEWLGVMTGTWRNHHRLVPATDDLETSTGTVTIPWTKEQVGAAPEYDEPDQPISEKLEQEAYRHYRREPAATT